MTIRERLARKDPTVAEYQNSLANSHNNIGNLYRATGKPSEALAVHQQALKIRKRLARKHPTLHHVLLELNCG